ncbi:6832_t:CDS:2 [Entrophospora sp. SA101]|nr:6826_t:CDS:2 [Entrophospora sp. SA101]CAJ0646200.1 6832_t:CDS:2 [Entrophospora sp. SA101]CAJ0833829.1 17490_t:CDS:2 [Entrophospora sp. SA101]
MGPSLCLNAEDVPIVPAECMYTDYLDVEENDNANFRPKTLEESIVENVHSSASTTPNDSPKTLMSQQQEQRLIIPFVSPPPALSPVFSTLSSSKLANKK